MADDLESSAFEDLDQIAVESRKALNALSERDTESAQELLEAIENRADSWSDP